MKTNSITKVTLLSIFVMSVITAVTLNSCQKDNIKPKIVTTTASQSAVSANVTTANSIISEANNIMFSMRSNTKGLIPNAFDSSSCAVITTDTIAKPYSITYTYGSNCVGSDGKTRSGTVILTYANTDIRVVNNSITITFQNYSLNATTYNGQINVTNNGPNGAGNQVLAQTGTIAGTTQGKTDTVNINYQYEWLLGESSSPAANWQFSVTGTITGSSSTGTALNITINTPLIQNKKTPGCNYCISGTEQITEGTKPVESIDFGNPGGCSGQEAVTQNGVTTIQGQ